MKNHRERERATRKQRFNKQKKGLKNGNWVEKLGTLRVREGFSRKGSESIVKRIQAHSKKMGKKLGAYSTLKRGSKTLPKNGLPKKAVMWGGKRGGSNRRDKGFADQLKKIRTYTSGSQKRQG